MFHGVSVGVLVAGLKCFHLHFIPFWECLSLLKKGKPHHQPAFFPFVLLHFIIFLKLKFAVVLRLHVFFSCAVFFFFFFFGGGGDFENSH